jgi:phosphoglycerate dehydrogenase-like enzyme
LGLLLISAGVDKYLTIPEIKNNPSITLTNARGAYSVPLAEYTIISLLYFNYHIPTYFKSFTNKTWERPVNELTDKKTILIMARTELLLLKELNLCLI